MARQELLEYIKQNLERGVSEDSIRRALINIGWNTDDVESTLALPTSQNKYVIETRNLTKYYRKKRGVENINLSIRQGEVFGFLGPNGAGKTTTIRLLLGLLKPTSGEATIFGMSVNDSYQKILNNVGYLSSDAQLYNNMTGAQLIDYTAGIRGYRSAPPYAYYIIKKLECNLQTVFKKLSRGNKQKIAILLALMHEPNLLILDEPTSGLDPLTQIEFYSILNDLKKRGTTIFFSSHNLPEVEKICDRIGIIKNGSLITVETLPEIRLHQQKLVELHCKKPYDFTALKKIPEVYIIDEHEETITFYVTSNSMQDVLSLLTTYEIADLSISYPDLEQTFLKYYNN